MKIGVIWQYEGVYKIYCMYVMPCAMFRIMTVYINRDIYMAAVA
jgi:hypothetical protein